MARLRFAPVVVLAVLAAGCSRSAPDQPARHVAPPRQISEQQALDLLIKQLKAHKVAGLDCVSFMDESDHPPDAKAAEWEFAAHEIHDARCGGDPGVAPVRARYQVMASGRILVYNAAEAGFVKFPP